MLLTIHNLPIRTQYSDVKDLIILKCGLKEVILDNLQNEGSGVRVTVGVMEEEDAAILVRKINGLYYRGQQLYVQDKRQTKESEQPYRTSAGQQAQYIQPQPSIDYNTQMQTLGMYQPMNYALYQPSTNFSTTDQTVQNAYMGFGGVQGQPQPLMSYAGLGEYQQPYSQPQPEPEYYTPPSREHSRWDEAQARAPSPPRLDRGLQEYKPRHDYGRDGQRDGLDRSPGFVRSQNLYERKPRHHEEDARGGPRQDVGHSSRSHMPRGRDPRGDFDSNHHISRGGHEKNERSRGDFGPSQKVSRSGLGSNEPYSRRGVESNEYVARDGRSSNQHVSRGRDSGEYGSRGGLGSYEPGSRGRNSRGGHVQAFHSRGEYDDSRDDRPRNTTFNKRRWEEPADDDERRPQGEWNEPSRTERPSRSRYREFGTHGAPPQKKHRDFAAQNAAPLNKQRDFAFQNAMPLNKHRDFAVQNESAANKYTFRMNLTKSSGMLMFEIGTNLKIIPMIAAGPSPLKKALRKAVNYRVHSLTTKDELVPPEEIVQRYRELYPKSDDLGFFNKVKQIVAAGESIANTPPNKPAPANIKIVKKSSWNPPPMLPGKIPSHVEEEVNRQQMQDRQILTKKHTLEDSLQKALQEEIDLITAILAKEFKNPNSQIEKNIFKSLEDQKECLEQSKKFLYLQLSKRLSDSDVKLARVFCHPRPPRRTELEEYLKKQGCLSLKKSLKATYYTASFKTYEKIDELCQKEVQLPSGVIVTFKHMHYMVHKSRIDLKNAKNIRKKYIQSLIEHSKVNMLDKNWQKQEQEEKKAQKEIKETIDSDDVILGHNVPDLTVKTTDDDATVMKCKENTQAMAPDGNQEFLNGDFKVIDEVHESDCDEFTNEEGTGNNVIADDWDETGENWRDVIGDGGNVDNAGEVDNVEDDDDEDEDFSGEVGDVAGADFDVDDIDIGDLDEDDLEDY